MVSALEANAAAFLAVMVLGVGALLLGVSLLSWSRLRHRRVLFIAAGFALLALKGAVATWRVLQGGSVDLASGALDFGLVLLLYASVAAR